MPKRDKAPIKAIPTSFNGVEYKSRLEARFAEWLNDQGVPFYPEPHPNCYQDYVPDFVIPGLLMFVEVKPQCFIKETDLFWDQIKNGPPWVCVDMPDRGEWRIIRHNFIFSMGVHFSDSTFSIDVVGNKGPHFLCVKSKETQLIPWMLTSTRQPPLEI